MAQRISWNKEWIEANVPHLVDRISYYALYKAEYEEMAKKIYNEHGIRLADPLTKTLLTKELVKIYEGIILKPYSVKGKRKDIWYIPSMLNETPDNWKMDLRLWAPIKRYKLNSGNSIIEEKKYLNKEEFLEDYPTNAKYQNIRRAAAGLGEDESNKSAYGYKWKFLP